MTKDTIRWDALKMAMRMLLLFPTENTKSQKALLESLDQSQVCMFSKASQPLASPCASQCSKLLNYILARSPRNHGFTLTNG